MREILSILRFHIILIAIFGTLVFGWLITGKYLILVALIGGIDWLLINLANRVSDIAEDLINQIPGAERVAGARTSILVIFTIVLIGSFGLSVWLFPQITGWRILIQITGFLYNFKVIPTSHGRKRLKDRYFFKNFLSAFGFFITCFGFPLAMSGYNPLIGWHGVVALIVFFMPYELTFEIFYDLRDVEGDRQAGVNTYPVVHGLKTSENIIYWLLIWSTLWLLGAFVIGLIGAREVLMAAGPIIQFIILRPLIHRGATIADCINVTHYGTVLLGFYLMGTAAWLWLGLAPNFYL